ncbi:MAG: hypothetical protein J7621_20695 [Niastella sp.]|nr:hypothetical protein [Niastella sp.]
MSDYKTSINALYKLKQDVGELERKAADIKKQLGIRNDVRLKKQLQTLEKNIATSKGQISNAITQLYTDPKSDPLLQIDEPNPILLLPLRLETRFAAGGNELWVRVYPDEIAINNHDAALTDAEVKAGSYFWKHLWEHSRLADFTEHRKIAWSQVVNRFGENRARWIFKQTKPVKLSNTEDFSLILQEADLAPAPLTTKPRAWHEAAKCYVMPDLLKLRLYVNQSLAFEVIGLPITYPLPVGPDPKATGAHGSVDWGNTDITWLEDFDKALDAGMAFKVNLRYVAGYNAVEGFSRITVMGIKSLFDESPLTTPPPKAGTKLLSSLFENHQYTAAGLALVPQGTSTNNTEERSSGFDEQGGFDEDRYEQLLRPSIVGNIADDRPDGQQLAAALGLDITLFDKLEHSRNTDRKEAITMNKALYPATLGFFLRHLLHPLFKPEQLDAIRSFFCSYITGRGPVPAFRKGTQPYGILPTSNFKQFYPTKDDVHYKLLLSLTELLREPAAAFEAGISNVSKLGQAKDVHELLDSILGLYPNSATFYQRIGYSESALRSVLATNVIQPPNKLLERLIARFANYTQAAPEGILQLKKLVFERSTYKLDERRLVDVAPVSETTSVSIPRAVPQPVHQGANYIQWLQQHYIRGSADIEKDYFAYTDPRIAAPLLYPLLKHGLLLQLYKCVFHWLSKDGVLAPSLKLFHDGSATADFIAPKEFLNFFKKQEDISAMELMMIDGALLPNKPPTDAVTYLLYNANGIIRNMLRLGQMTPEITNDFRYLTEFYSALALLANQPSARLERAMVEHLDCLTYRLDAWQTGLVYRKLEMHRGNQKATGTVVGAYGWLLNVRAASNVTYIPEADLPAELRPGSSNPIIAASAEGGYIHAPSMTQAKSAALSRSAYLHHHDAASPDMMAINLNAPRVRKALELFDGIQKGHLTGELLGYRFERFLHDQPVPLDKYIGPLRGAFPIGGRTIGNPGNANDTSATQSHKPATSVARLDGLAMINAIKGGAAYPFGIGQLPSTGADADVLKAGIADLTDCIDAMKDLMVAESVHHLVQGNTDRAGALLKSIHELKPPARFECIQTPRTPADILTHRASILLNPGDLANPVNPWPSIALSQRALTEPALNEWLGHVIGKPDVFQCRVTEVESRTNGLISLEDVQLQPIDIVYLAPTHWDEDSELMRRIAYHYRISQQIKEDVQIEIAWDGAEKKYQSFAELLPLLKLLKEVVTNAKVLDATDFDLQRYPGKTNAANLFIERAGGIVTDIGSLKTRLVRLVEIVEPLQMKLQKLAESSTSSCAELRECLIECCVFELRGAFPQSAVGEDDGLKQPLQQQAMAVVKDMKQMVATAQASAISSEGLTASFAPFFGPAFKVLPVFHFPEQADDEADRLELVRQAYDGEDQLFSFITDKTKLSRQKHIQNWLNGASYVRSKLAAFETARLWFNAFRQEQLDLHVMQLPFEKEDSWLGIEFPEKTAVRAGKLSMLLHHYPQKGAPDWKGAAYCGLLVDEWVEEIPGQEELTGISFQYNQPDSQPPQALLLAVAPKDNGKWNWNTLSDIIDDTLYRAKQRAVGTNELAGTDWIGVLPGALAEFSATKANLSAFFRNR